MPSPYQNVPALRGDAFKPDDQDPARVAFALKFWDGQTEVLRRRDRQIEENIRMLAGQHWTAWNVWLQKWQDVTEWMTDDERRWRQRPVTNRLLYWFMLTHARLTENPPILTWQPKNSARLSADLAEAMDTIFKGKWRDTGMTEVFDRLMAWLIPGANAYLNSVVDLNRGEWRTMEGQAMLPVLGPDGQQLQDDDGSPMERMATRAPFAPHPDTGEMVPQAHLDQDGQLVQTGEAMRMREGDIRVDVLSPLEVRGQWGPMPWHEKRWHITRGFLTPEEVGELFGVEDAGEPISEGTRTGDPGYLNRMIFGSGFFGSASGKPGAEFLNFPKSERLCEVYGLWQAPCNFEGMQEGPGEPGGRLLVVSRKGIVYRDGPRPIAFQHTSGLRCFTFVNVPGRPAGTTPQEMLNPLARSDNRLTAQILENATLIANPVGIIDQASGLGEIEMTNKPGERYVVNKRPGVTPFEYVKPPSLGRDVYQAKAQLRDDFDSLGHIQGAEGTPPTSDPSGKLVKELRFNSDRFLGSTARRNVEELARMAQDWRAILAVIWDVEKVASYNGPDDVVQSITVFPEMFREGSVSVIADVESMLPQSRAERQAQIKEIWQLGAWGDPMTPAASQRFLELARFPHISRTAWPGGMDVVAARQENGEMLRGVPWSEIPVLDWYDDGIHIGVHEHFMKSPQFRRLSPVMQKSFAAHREMHLRAQAAKMMRQEVQAQQMAAGIATVGAKHAAAVGHAGGGPPSPEAGQQVNADTDRGAAGPPSPSASEEA